MPEQNLRLICPACKDEDEEQETFMHYHQHSE